MTPQSVRLLVLGVPQTQDLLDEHMSTYGELLPTVLFAEVSKWVARSITDVGDFDAARKAIEVMECLAVAGSDDVKDLVVTGFLEGLPPGTEQDNQFLRVRGPTLYQDLMRLVGRS